SRSARRRPRRSSPQRIDTVRDGPGELSWSICVCGHSLVILRTHALPGTGGGGHHGRRGAGGWHWNDAWIFVSAVIAERLERDRAMHAALPITGATLADVLAAADFLPHTVPSRAELQDSVRRLPGAGLPTVAARL